MTNGFRVLAVVMLAAVLAGCAQPRRLQHSFLPFRESVNGDFPNLEETRPQKAGRGISEPVTKKTFRELTLAQGSGQTGFDTLRIYADGTGYVVVGEDFVGAAKLPITLSDAVMNELMAAIRADHVASLQGSYSSSLNDGAQAFVQVVTSRGTVETWFSNYFTPLHHLWEFANKHVWEDVLRTDPPPLLDRSYDRQEEHYRVFPYP